MDKLPQLYFMLAERSKTICSNSKTSGNKKRRKTYKLRFLKNVWLLFSIRLNKYYMALIQWNMNCQFIWMACAFGMSATQPILG